MQSSEEINSAKKSQAKRSLEIDAANILLVDDSLELLDALSLILEGSGLKVQTASSARDAFELLENTQPDLIISDVMMDDMDGFEFQEKVKENPKFCCLPFIFLSAVSDPIKIRKGKLAGCDDFLVKPLEAEDLLAAVQGKLSSFKARKKISDDYLKDVITRLSHEFRTPLVAINTGAELLKERFEKSEDESLIRLTESVYKGGSRLQRLVEDFSAFQDIQTGRARELHKNYKESCDFIEFINSFIDEAKVFKLPEEAKLNFKISEELEGKEIQVELFKLQVKNILSRLLSNSYKFAGLDKPVDLLLTSKSKNTVSIFIRDYGPGLNAENFQEVSKLFTQIGRESTEQQGVGLGIPICSYLAEINNAEIFLSKPKEGEGLEVEVRFMVLRP